MTKTLSFLILPLLLIGEAVSAARLIEIKKTPYGGVVVPSKNIWIQNDYTGGLVAKPHPSSASILWKSPCYACYVVAANDSIVIAKEETASSKILTALNVDNGRVLWRVNPEVYMKGLFLELDSESPKVGYAADENNYRVVDAASGRVLSTYSLSGRLYGPPAFIGTKAVFAYAQGAFAVIDSADGTSWAWQPPEDANTSGHEMNAWKFFSPAENVIGVTFKIFGTTSVTNPDGSTRFFDLRSGKQIGTLPWANDVVTTAGVFYMTHPRMATIAAYHATNRKPIWSKVISDARNGTGGLGKIDDHLIWAHNKIDLIDASNGTVLDTRELPLMDVCENVPGSFSSWVWSLKHDFGSAQVALDVMNSLDEGLACRGDAWYRVMAD